MPEKDGAIEYYELKKVTIDPPKPDEFRIATAAVLSCGLCGGMIDGMGGPGDGSICMPCGHHLKHGRLRGEVKWSEEPDKPAQDQ